MPLKGLRQSLVKPEGEARVFARPERSRGRDSQSQGAATGGVGPPLSLSQRTVAAALPWRSAPGRRRRRDPNRLSAARAQGGGGRFLWALIVALVSPCSSRSPCGGEAEGRTVPLRLHGAAAVADGLGSCPVCRGPVRERQSARTASATARRRSAAARRSPLPRARARAPRRVHRRRRAARSGLSAPQCGSASRAPRLRARPRQRA